MGSAPKSDRQIFDVGRDLKRATPSEYYDIEEQALHSAGLKKVFVRDIAIDDGSTTQVFKLFEWVRPTP